LIRVTEFMARIIYRSHCELSIVLLDHLAESVLCLQHIDKVMISNCFNSCNLASDDNKVGFCDTVILVVDDVASRVPNIFHAALFEDPLLLLLVRHDIFYVWELLQNILDDIGALLWVHFNLLPINQIDGTLHSYELFGRNSLIIYLLLGFHFFLLHESFLEHSEVLLNFHLKDIWGLLSISS